MDENNSNEKVETTADNNTTNNSIENVNTENSNLGSETQEKNKFNLSATLKRLKEATSAENLFIDEEKEAEERRLKEEKIEDPNDPRKLRGQDRVQISTEQVSLDDDYVLEENKNIGPLAPRTDEENDIVPIVTPFDLVEANAGRFYDESSIMSAEEMQAEIDSKKSLEEQKKNGDINVGGVLNDMDDPNAKKELTEEEKEALAQEEARKGKRKLIIFIVIVLIVVTALGLFIGKTVIDDIQKRQREEEERRRNDLPTEMEWRAGEYIIDYPTATWREDEEKGNLKGVNNGCTLTYIDYYAFETDIEINDTAIKENAFMLLLEKTGKPLEEEGYEIDEDSFRKFRVDPISNKNYASYDYYSDDEYGRVYFVIDNINYTFIAFDVRGSDSFSTTFDTNMIALLTSAEFIEDR